MEIVYDVRIKEGKRIAHKRIIGYEKIFNMENAMKVLKTVIIINHATAKFKR